MTTKGQGDKPTFTPRAPVFLFFWGTCWTFFIFVVPTEFPKLFPKFPNLIPDMFPISGFTPTFALSSTLVTYIKPKRSRLQYVCFQDCPKLDLFFWGD
jgi:hypothetical protein